MRQYIDTTLYEIAYIYMRKKNIELTTGNLFWIMEKIVNKLDYINKNTKEKKIIFKDEHCEFETK